MFLIFGTDVENRYFVKKLLVFVIRFQFSILGGVEFVSHPLPMRFDANHSPISLPHSYLHTVGYFADPREGEREHYCDIKEKMLGAEFWNKNFFSFKRSQKFAIDLEKICCTFKSDKIASLIKPDFTNGLQ